MENLTSTQSENGQIKASGPGKNGFNYPRTRSQLGLTISFIGFTILIFGLKPEVFGLSSSLSVGFAQILAFLIGLGILVWGATIALSAFWPKGNQSLLADFGVRVIATGYIICVFTGLADAFGFGTNPLPDVFMGGLQRRGVIIGMSVILIGLVMMIRFKKYRDSVK
ncbi:MAG TPA: hypothetical protein VLR89_03975 [Anaerolineaceae bacterium]|nr:hypothetical protein [Anaerolineaceae bacterium]